jgi:glycosyltransferase involved in cell wall biosynthesis
MKILYIHQYFVTPQEPGATRSYWISKELVKRGHHVTVITGNSESKHEPGRFDRDGIDVIYVNNYYNNTQTKIQKVWSFIKFIFQSIKVAAKEKDVDLVYATSTPLTIGAVALALRRIKGWRYVFEVRDLWPEFPIQVGAITNPVFIWLLRKFEKRIYKRSEHVVALSPGMQEGVIKAGTPIEKTSMIPNMSKPDIFYPHEVNMDIVKQFEIDLTKFNVIHFGMLAVANGLEYIVKAAIELKKRGDESIQFLFMGEGAMQPMLEEMVRENDLHNVRLLGNYKVGIVAEVTNCCDASITSFKNLPILATNSPNKLFDSLSAGKTIIVNSAGWTKDMVEKDNCGFYVDPEKSDMLADKLLEVKDNKPLLEEWGKNARRLSVEVYDKAKLSAQVADVLEETYRKLKK